ncbi:putative sterol carrier protein [Saccharopolyspora lacisalsi]|uniref:Putative sterol carrier protein n=1 Tax=Halosaccharopolyspora lacisalsi TaxID=1000566 RepID=A0A839DYQ1_9PSEU|nr:SCP2 sterol-binding domain-containing protein [Halosaccharopolyspora lacisalsi]MBA8826614.1 putative sterol carrier protein [Halosaccharopolyspora lacisalsi]
MPVFSSSEQAQEVFRTLFEILLEDDVFLFRMTDSNLSLHLVQTKPDVEMFVSPDGVHDGPPPSRATIRIKMSCDTAHSLWKGELLMPMALGTGKVRIKGSVSKVMEFVPILQPAFDRYPEIIAARKIES